MIEEFKQMDSKVIKFSDEEIIPYREKFQPTIDNYAALTVTKDSVMTTQTLFEKSKCFTF